MVGGPKKMCCGWSQETTRKQILVDTAGWGDEINHRGGDDRAREEDHNIPLGGKEAPLHKRPTWEKLEDRQASNTNVSRRDRAYKRRTGPTF